MVSSMPKSDLYIYICLLAMRTKISSLTYKRIRGEADGILVAVGEDNKFSSEQLVNKYFIVPKKLYFAILLMIINQNYLAMYITSRLGFHQRCLEFKKEGKQRYLNAPRNSFDDYSSLENSTETISWLDEIAWFFFVLILHMKYSQRCKQYTY